MRLRISSIPRSKWWIPAGLAPAILATAVIHGTSVDVSGQTPATLSAAQTPAPSSTNSPTPAPPTSAPSAPAPAFNLDSPRLKEIAMQLVASAENSTLNWRGQYGYIDNLHDGRGFTGGIIGFCSGTGDMYQLVQDYSGTAPASALASFLPALAQLSSEHSSSGNPVDSTNTLGQPFVTAWRQAGTDPRFQQAQDSLRDAWYFNPAVAQAKADGLHALGQFIYYDAIVNHGPGNDPGSFGGLRSTAMRSARTPAQGGNESAYLHAFLSARLAAMSTGDFGPTDRITTQQMVFLNQGNLSLQTPLRWSTYGDSYFIP